MRRLAPLEFAILRALAHAFGPQPGASTLGIIVLASGGLDSQCLLSALARIARSLHWTERTGLPPLVVRALHCDHMTRPGRGTGTNAADFAAVSRSCLDAGVELEFVRPDAPLDAEGNFQAAARHWRYACAEAARVRFSSALCGSPVLIATGHHARDVVEGVLLHLVRGAGPEGLAGLTIHDAKRGLVRPMATMPHAQLRSYAQARDLAWSEDPSNAEAGYMRNVVRHDLLPVLEKLNPSYEAAFARATASLRSLLASNAKHASAPASLSGSDHHASSQSGLVFASVSTSATEDASELAARSRAALLGLQGAGAELARAMSAAHWLNLAHHIAQVEASGPGTPPARVPLPGGAIAWCFPGGVAFVGPPAKGAAKTRSHATSGDPSGG